MEGTGLSAGLVTLLLIFHSRGEGMFLFEGWVVIELLTLKLSSLPFGSRAGLGCGRMEVGGGG